MPRRKSEYKVQVMSERDGWVDAKVKAEANHFASVAGIMKVLRQFIPGEYRIIAVKRIVKVSKVESVRVSVVDAEGEAK